MTTPQNIVRTFIELDVYPPNKSHITDLQLTDIAEEEINKQGLQGKLSASNIREKLKAAFKINTVWDLNKYPVLKIAFMDGNDHQRKFVKDMVMERIAPITSKIQYQWDVPLDQSMIRISFAIPKQAWSLLGTDALGIPANQPTMNLGWLDDDIQFDSPYYKGSGQVVLHEFCHALGMIHEHTNPKGKPIQWNKEVVYKEIAASNGWSKQQIDNNMFSKYGDKEACDLYAAQLAKMAPGAAISSEGTFTGPDGAQLPIPFCGGELTNGSDYDVHSIMHYYFPSRWVVGDADIPKNLVLSPMDKYWLAKYYGVPPDTPPSLEATSGAGSTAKQNPSAVEHFITNQSVRNVLFAPLDDLSIWDSMYSRTTDLTIIVIVMALFLLFRTFQK
jgi:hypothetical protein